MGELIFKDESYAIVGAAMKVHKTLGAGFSEAVYQEALAIELEKQNVPFEREKQMHIVYDGIQLKKTFQVDFVCYNKIIVELKAMPEIIGTFRSQIINYLKVANMPLGILINFGESSLCHERFVNNVRDNLFNHNK